MASGVALLATAACDPRASIWERSLEVEGPVVAGGQLVHLVRTTGQVVTLDPKRGVTAYPVGARARALTATPSGVAVIGGRGSAPVLDLVALPEGARRRIDLPAPYDRIWVAPGGARLLLTFDPSAPQAPGAVPARNMNEVGVVDLATGRVEQVLLRTESLAPREVIFDASGALAAVLLDAAVALVDLGSDPPEVVTIPLRLPGGVHLTPLKGLFAPDASRLYLRVEGSADVLALEISRGAAFGATVNFLYWPDATALKDIALVEGYPDHVAALFERGEGGALALLEGSGDQARSFGTALSARPTRLYDLGEGHVLACAAPAATSGVYSRYVAVFGLERRRLDEDSLPGTTSSLPRVAGGRAIFDHGGVALGGGDSSAALTVLRAEEDALRLRVRLSPVVLGGQATLAGEAGPDGSILVAVRAGREDAGAPPDLDGSMAPDVAFLTVVDAEGQPGPALLLDEVVGSVGVTGDLVWARHPSPTGDVTVAPLSSFTRSAARRAVGLFFAGLSEAEEVAR